MRRRSLFGWTAAAALAALPALAGELTVTGAWSRSTPPDVTVGVVYFTLSNDTGRSDRLLKLATPAASGAQIHRTELLDGIARMREVAVLHVAAGETLEFRPGGMHVMLLGLRQPLVDGQSFDLELQFEVAGPRKVRVAIRNP